MALSITNVVKGLPISKLLLRGYSTVSHSKVFSSITENKKTGYIVKQMNEIIDDVLLQFKPRKEFPELGRYLKRAAEYTSQHGKKLRYALTVNAYDMVEEPGLKNAETLKLAQVTGLCWELLHCGFLMSDDMEDGSESRHSQPCWYTLPDVGVKVITDVCMVRGLQHEIFNKWFDGHPKRWVIGEMFHKIYFYTAIGQYLDRVISQVKNEDYSNFTTKKWETLINYKAGGYCVYAPVLSGLALTKKTDIEQIKNPVKEICYRFGQILSMQNDFYDAYADFEVLNKDGVDIQEGKCTWLSVTALERATPAQRRIFARNYGRAQAEHVTKVKELYDDLKLQEVFIKSRNQMIDETKEMIHRLPDDQLKIMMMDIVSLLSHYFFAH